MRNTIRHCKFIDILRTCVCFAICLSLLCTVGIPLNASAEETAERRVIRVGSPEDIYDDINEQGGHTGFGYEYLQKIANYTGWKYEYVPCTWDDCYDKLQNGEIDILEAISYTDERAETMAFSDMPMSVEKYYIFAKLGETDISVSDISTFDGKNVGVLKGHLPEAALDEWTEKNGLHMNHLNIVTKENTIERMNRNEIECFVSVEGAFWGEYGMAPVITIGSSGIYFAFRKDSADIKEQLDNAMLRISEEYPFFNSDLYKRYFSDIRTPVLAKDEQEWLEKHGAIRIGYLKNDGAVSTYHEDTGEVTGLISDFVSQTGTGLYGQTIDYELVGFDSRYDLPDALHNGEIDMIFYVTQNLNSAEKYGYDLTDTTWSANMAAVTARGFFDEEEENTVAIVSGKTVLRSYIANNYPKWTFAEYDSQDEVIKAVRSGKADCFVVDSGDAANYTGNNKLYSFVLSQPNNASFAVEHGNIKLLSILNKVLETMSSSRVSGLLTMYSNELNKVTLLDFFRDNLAAVIVFIGIVFLIMLSLLMKSIYAEKRAREARIQAEAANNAKTVFLNNMSHDIRTPINGIIGMLNIMKKSKDDPVRTADCVNKIENSSKLLLSLINDVLDMAKLESNAVILKNESTNLDRLCKEVSDSIYFQAESAGIMLTEDHDDYEDVIVLSSPTHLKKVLINLFTNAVKYNKPNGSIHMSMKTIERTEDELVCEFKISDTGIGMSEDFVKNKLFTPFVQADTSSRSKYVGTGLGMCIVKDIIEKMDGTITVESKLGEGSTFTFVLPFRIDHNAVPEAYEEIGDHSIAGMNLLLVEDNELNAEIAVEMLKEEGVSVVVAENGKIAVDLFGQSPEGTFDAVLMDMMMPVMDGLDATRAIRKLNRPDAKTIPIIAMTANAFSEDAKRCIEAGMNAHLAKPLEMETVKKIICEQVKKCVRKYT